MSGDRDWLDYWGDLTEGLGEPMTWVVAAVLLAWVAAMCLSLTH
jgi:hypothetical protein